MKKTKTSTCVKRALALLLALMMALSLVACNADQSASSDKPSSNAASGAVSNGNGGNGSDNGQGDTSGEQGDASEGGSSENSQGASSADASQGTSSSGSSDKPSSDKPSSSGSSSSQVTPVPPATSTSKVVVYPEYDARIERDYTYDVSVVQGDKTYDLTCYNHCDAVATSDRTVDGDMYRRFCEFAFTGSQVRVDITVYTDFSSYTVMPSAKEFHTERNGNVISVYLDKPEYFLLKLDKSDNSILAVFADEPETNVPKKTDSNVIYVDGWYEPADGGTVLTLNKANTTLYLAPGSVLNARVKVTAKNVTIKGRGMILDPYSNIYKTDISSVSGKEALRYLLHVTGQNCTIDGIKMIDSRDFNLWVQCTGLKVTNLKILSSEMCTDGITPHQGGGNSFKHCFLYVGDNALVLSRSDTTSVFEDITIGTICCGIFPQNNAGKYQINNIYIFRADEGVMRNTYTWQNEPRSFSLTLNNVSAVDCDHFPFIFYGYNMGTLPKSITFNNLAVPTATGSQVLSQNTGNIIRVENVSGKLATNNYTLTFNGLSVGGKAVTSASSLKTNMTSGNTVKVTGSGSKFGPATANKKSGSVKPEGKIFIGERQLLVKNRAVKKDGTWYVPAADVCAAVGKSVPSSTTTINGAKYISLANLTSSKVAKSATYDSSKGRIKIGVPTGTTGDLLSWFGNSAHSHWSEYVCYNMHMIWLKEYGGNSFRMKCNYSGSGISYNLTPQFKQYGTGKYTLTFQAKANKSTSMNVVFKVNGNNVSTNSKNLTTSWQTITVTFNSYTAAKGVNNACLALASTASGVEIDIKNAKLVYNG